MGLLQKIMNLFIIIKIYYWFSAFPILRGILKLNREMMFSGHKYWASRTCQYLKVKFVQLAGSKKFVDQKRMIFANHKSQADFFLHNYILEYKANFLSRFAVAVLIPTFLTAYETVWFFRRDKKSTPQKFNQWLDKKFEASPRKSLVAYIEGHRMTGSEKVDKSKLKTGMIKYAYRRKIRCQFLMTFGNEQIFNEKKLQVNFNQKAYYKLSDIVEPAEFETEIQFVDYIKDNFCQFFDEVHQQLPVECIDKKQN